MEAKGKSTEGVETFEEFYGFLKSEALLLQKKYQPQLREGIKIAVDLVNSVKEEEKDGDVDMKVTIAPNKTEEEFKIRSKSGKYTEPELPSSVIVSENGVVIEHYYRSNDHAPAHMHVTGDGTNGKIRIGANGRVLDGDPPLNSKQKSRSNK